MIEPITGTQLSNANRLCAAWDGLAAAFDLLDKSDPAEQALRDKILDLRIAVNELAFKALRG
jgi:hypothetical protein